MSAPVRSAHREAHEGKIVASVAALATAPVKGLRLQSRDALRLDAAGPADDRRFFLIDDRDQMLNSRRIRKLSAAVAQYDHEHRRLSITFPDGGLVAGQAEPTEPVTARFFRRELPTVRVPGPWDAAFSRYSGRRVRLVMVPDGAPGADRGAEGTVSLMSRASIERLAQEAGHAVDPRRFRMLIEVDGTLPHAEDGWVGHRLRIGEATVRINGHVGRCIVTVLNPDTGRGDMPTLELLRQYRAKLDTTEPLALGVFGEVLAPGVLRRGDPVLLLD